MTTPEEHDRLIGYTSQLAHVVSSAYVKSPEAMKHPGFSAGSFKDMTRVARLSEKMWTELFLLNRDELQSELDALIEPLEEYRAALSAGDAEGLQTMRNLARNMAWLLKCIELGRQNGVNAPENEYDSATNFIR